MNEREPDFSRVGRKKNRNRSNNILNILIGVVVVLIIVIAATIFSGDKDDEEANGDSAAGSLVDDTSDDEGTDSSSLESTPTEDDDSNKGSGEGGNSDSSSTSSTDGQQVEIQDSDSEESENPGKVTIVPSDDDVISESIVDTSWKPIGTTQTGEHVSLYDGESVDWNEKKQALAYATGLSEESMIFWKIKNGGGPQKSIGIVSTRDSKEKYRVYLEWVDGEGWKPVKKDVLTTLDVED